MSEQGCPVVGGYNSKLGPYYVQIMTRSTNLTFLGSVAPLADGVSDKTSEVASGVGPSMLSSGQEFGAVEPQRLFNAASHQIHSRCLSKMAI